MLIVDGIDELRQKRVRKALPRALLEMSSASGGEPPAAVAAGSAEGHGVRCSDDRSLSDADADYHEGVRLLDRLWDACDSLDADKSGSVQASGDLGNY